MRRASRTPRRAPAAASAAAAALVLAAACGKVGPPVPPEPRGPSAPTQVRARQVGPVAVVEYRIAPPRGAKPGQQPAAAELIRVTFGPGIEPAGDPDVFRRRGKLVLVRDLGEDAAGRAFADEDPTLGGPGSVEPGSSLRYAVRIRDRRGRPSPLVATGALTLLPEGPPPAALASEPIPGGIRLRWRPPADSAGIRLYRAPVDPDAPVSPEDGDGAGGAPRPAPVARLAGDATTWDDLGVEPGRTYRYVARSLLAEGETLRESVDSAPATQTAVDRFPPAPPAGLVAVQEGAAVRLFWNPSAERDLAGYRVERRRPPDGTWTRLAAVTTPTYRDPDVAIGDVWEYRVLAFDESDPPNESAAGTPVSVTVVAEPLAGEAPARDGGGGR